MFRGGRGGRLPPETSGRGRGRGRGRDGSGRGGSGRGGAAQQGWTGRGTDNGGDGVSRSDSGSIGMAMRGGAGGIRRNFDPERRFFDAVVRNGEFQEPGDAQRFMLALTNYVDKLDLLTKLTNDEGPAVLKKAITRSVTQLSDLTVYVMPILSWLGSDELCGMMCKPQLCCTAKNLMETPGLLPLLRKGYIENAIGKHKVGAAGGEEEISLAWFIHLCCSEFPEARKADHECYRIAVLIIECGHVDELCESLTILLALDKKEKDGEEPSRKPVVAATIQDLRARAGGRHDNDMANFRDVSIMPTVAEIECTQPPHLPGPSTVCCSEHLERQFRLLREDLIGPARVELQLLSKGEGDRRKCFSRVALERVDVNENSNRKVMIVVSFDLAPGHKTLSMAALKDRVAYWETYSKGMLQMDSLVLLVGPDSSQVFATVIHREARELAGLDKDFRPRIGLRLQAVNSSGVEVSGHFLKFVGRGPVCEMLLVTSSFFSYEPILKVLQKRDKIALADVILQPASYHPKRPGYLEHLPNLETLFPQTLNPSQVEAMENVFGSELALVQGPPGTGKTYIERCIIELIYRHTDEVILLEAYTNHALDQVLEGLLGNGITEIVRIGGRSKSKRLEPYMIKTLIEKRKSSMPSGFKRRAAILYERRSVVEAEAKKLAARVNMKGQSASWLLLSEYLRTKDKNVYEELNCQHLCGSAKGEFHMVGKKGKAITPYYLWDLWKKGETPPEQEQKRDKSEFEKGLDLWKKSQPRHAADRTSYDKALFPNAHRPDSIWRWSKRQRLDSIDEWLDDVTAKDRVSLAALLEEMVEVDDELRTLHKEPYYELLMDKSTRIIGVTSTGASLYADILAAVKPGVVIGEEAGELLEAHMLAGTHKGVKHMVLIGDHKQLRPKIENHHLSVASGNGHDLNRSLFERLIRAGLRHTTLLEQHRMHPEISSVIQELGIYPGLSNYPQTEQRERIRGIARRVCFIDHREMERQQAEWKAQTDTSKSNLYEAQMVAYTCRYLLQQGYKASDITVLTTYLGQVVEINKQLGEVMRVAVDINDRDMKDLTAGGIEIEGGGNQNGGKTQTARQRKTSDNAIEADDRIRVSTVDNYQGEENKIVVVSLVRSNAERQIGFLKEPERLTVLLSRAQCLEILVGNGECLRNAKNAQGAEWWERLLTILDKNGQVVPGLPVKCALHERCNMLLKKDDFEQITPNGGCTLECTATLSCGHRCPLKCHAFDSAHKDVRCTMLVPFVCSKGHTVFGVCSDVAELSTDMTRSENHCDVCNDIARIEKAKDKEIASIMASEQKRRRQEVLEQAAADKEIEEERARLQESRNVTERMRAKELRALALEKIKRERELEEFCRDDELERLVREEEGKMEQELAASEREIALRNNALAQKVKALREKRERQRDSQEQHLSNLINEAQRRGDERLRGFKKDNVVNADDLAPLFVTISDALNKTDETAASKVIVLRKLLDAERSSDASDVPSGGRPATDAPAQLKLVAKGLGMRSVGELRGLGSGKPNAQLAAFLEEVARGRIDWLEIYRRMDARLSSIDDPELELFHRFVALQMLSGTRSDAELAKCRTCLERYAGNQLGRQREPLAVVKSSVYYILLNVATCDAESEGNPSLPALKAALQLLLHPDMTLLEGVPELCVKYLDSHLGVMISNKSDESTTGSGSKSASEKRQVQRKMNARRSKALTELENMVGLENIKNLMEQMSARIDLDRERGVDVKQQQMSMRFDGNPGTGKTSVARIYGDFLKEKGVLGSDFIFKETSGAKLIAEGVDKLKKMVEEDMKAGGVLFIDEAYQLNPKSNLMGSQILDYLLPEMENRRGNLVVVVAGYCKPMDDLMAANEGLPSRFPERFVFEDYTEKELLMIFTALMRPGNFKLQDEKYARIAARRLARQSNTIGFGNARAVRNLLDLAKKRQAARLVEERQQGRAPDVFMLVRDDLLGPKGLDVSKCDALAQLKGMRGLNAVKQSVEELIKMVAMNAELEDLEKKVRDVNLNRCFLGNPGTGKTTVARIYGSILRAMGMLTKGDVIVKNPQDFTGEVLGQSEAKTKAILDNARGCVLVIDEAYGLHAGKKTVDPYKTAVVDTIVAEVQGVPGDDRCVLLLGYKAEMEEMMRNTNPGLARRFNLKDAFHFEDYSDEDLLGILLDKVHQLDMEIDLETALGVVKILADERRSELNFGNAGAVDNLLSSAKLRMMTRLKQCSASQMAQAGVKFQASDFCTDSVPVSFSVDQILLDPKRFIDRNFADLMGCGSVKTKVKQFISTIAFARKQGRDPLEDIELNFFFGGPPGTGKTTVARKFAALLKALGLICKDTVKECSASDLVTGFVGQAGRQTREVFRSALGGVLFIDEAYRLDPQKGGPFVREALDEIVQILTEKDFKNNMAVIIAGYEEDMTMLFNVNPGLKSRIQTTIVFEKFSAVDANTYLKRRLQEKGVRVSPNDETKVLALCDDLVVAPHWSNGRDVDTLANQIFQKHADWVTDRAPLPEMSTSDTSKEGECEEVEDDVVNFSVIEAAWHELISQKQRSASNSHSSDRLRDQILPTLMQDQQALDCAIAPACTRAANLDTHLPTSVQEQEPLDAGDYTDEEVLNHFAGFDRNFLSDIQGALEEMGVDVGDMEKIAIFDIQKLFSKFGSQFGLVKQWQNKIREAWEQAKRMEEELAQKQRAKRPKWRCAICGRPFCRVAPYIEGYEDVEV